MLLPVASEDSPFRVLVLTADDQLGRTLYVNLEKAGFEVRRVAEAIMGLAIWEGFNPHLVVMDSRPGALDGLAVTRQVRSDDYRIPIVLVGTTSPDDELLALKTGADDYVAEPVKVPSLLARVVAQLRRAYKYNLPPEEKEELQPFWEQDEESTDTDAEAAPDEFAPLDEFFVGGGEGPAKPDVLPPDWMECERCDYRAPRKEFEKEDLLGRIKLVCPNCKETDVMYSLNL